MTQRVQLWPLWAVVLGLWYPLDFISVLDGYHHFLRLRQFPFVYAAGWLIHAVPVLLFLLLAAVGQRLLVRSPRLVGWAQWLVVALARALAGVVLFYVLHDWLRSVSSSAASAVPTSLRLIACLAMAAALLLTWRNPRPGPLLQLGRKVGIGSAIAVAVLLPIEAVLTALETQHAPHGADLKSGSKPDVVLITIDTLGANHMSLYGYERETTPQLDAFAKGATVFDRFYANSNFTTPTSVSFLYGARSWTHRAWNVGSRPVDAVYGRNLLQAFHDAGYRVLTVDTNPCAAPAQNRLLPWVDALRTLQIRTSFLWTYWPDRWLPSFDAAFVTRPTHRLEKHIDQLLLKLGIFQPGGHFAPQVAFDAAKELWTQESDRPRFLWVHLFGPHDPYAAPAEFLGRFDPSDGHRTRFDSSPPYQWNASRDRSFPASLIGRYDESVLYFDRSVGEFLGWLKENGSFDGSVIAVSADHGEAFSRGYGGHGGPLLSEELIHIPLIIKGPAQAHGTRSAVVGEQVDLPQTLLQLAGLPTLPDVEGRAIGLDATEDDDPAFAMNFERNRRFDELRTGSIAMLQGPWKYVHYLNLKPYVNMPPITDELYDLRADPREQVNLLTADPQRSASMKAAILEELQKHAAEVP